MNGTPWTESHTATLHRLAGRVRAAEIGKITGHSTSTIYKRMDALGLSGRAGRPRPEWSRRDYLLNSAAGLDFQISL